MRQLPPNQKDQPYHRQRHRKGKPFKRFVAETGRGGHSRLRNPLFCRHWNDYSHNDLVHLRYGATAFAPPKIAGRAIIIKNS
jgi:hypothetical protein